MKRVSDHLRDSIYKNLGLGERKKLPSLQSLQRTEWSDNFETLMRNRLIVGGIRYGLLHDKSKANWDRIPSMIHRLEQYADTGNLEYLVDVANLCMLEFEEGQHPLKHFLAQDDTHHVKETK